MTAPQQTTSTTVAQNIRILLAEENVRRVKAGEKRMAVAHIAAKLGHTRQWIERRLAGTTPIRMEDIDRIAGVLGVAPAKLTQPRK